MYIFVITAWQIYEIKSKSVDVRREYRTKGGVLERGLFERGAKLREYIMLIERVTFCKQ